MDELQQNKDEFQQNNSSKFNKSQYDLIRISQNTSFKEEISNLKKENHVNAT